MQKRGNSWTRKWAGPAPFPNRGQPNLLSTREGVILLVNVGQWTGDLGTTWRPVADLPGMAYCPKSVQLADGRILVFAHIGGDDPYGEVDQAMVVDRFRRKAP